MTTTRKDAFSPDQERDENGKWVSTGGGSEVKKAAGGGIVELKRTERGTVKATHSKGGRASHMGEYSSPEKAKAAIAEHEAKVKERLRTTGANSARVHNQVTESIMAKREERNAMMGTPVAPDLGAKVAEIRAKREARNAEVLKYGGTPAQMQRAVRSKANAEARSEGGSAYAREMESRRAAITGNVKPQSPGEPSREERRASITGRSAPVTKTYDPTKPYGNTTEERWNGGQRHQVTVQNKPEPLRYRGKSIKEKEEQYQKDLTRMRERQAAREAERAAPRKEHWFSRARREMGERMAEEQRLGPLGMAKKYGAEARLRKGK